MGALQRDKINTKLLNRTQYTFNGIKHLMSNLLVYKSLSEHGDSVAIVIVADLENALSNRAYVSEEQHEIMILSLVYGYTQHELSNYLNKSQKTISNIVNRGIKGVEQYLGEVR